MSYEDTGWKNRAKLIKHLRWNMHQAQLAAWALEKPLPAGAELVGRVSDKFGDWMDPSPHKTKPHTPAEYKIEKSLHQSSAEARRGAANCRRQAAEWRDRALGYRLYAEELEGQIAELLRGEDWG